MCGIVSRSLRETAKRGGKCWGGVAILERVTRGVLTKKVTFEAKLERPSTRSAWSKLT